MYMVQYPLVRPCPAWPTVQILCLPARDGAIEHSRERMMATAIPWMLLTHHHAAQARHIALLSGDLKVAVDDGDSHEDTGT